MNRPRATAGRTLAAVLVVVLGVAAVTGSSSSDQTATKVGSGGTTAPGNATTPSTFKVGDQIRLGDWTIVVNAVTDPYTPSNGFDAPDPGKRYVAVDTTVTNGSSTTQDVSSMACFTLQDSTAQEYDESIVTGLPKSPDGAVAPGQSVRGSLAYEVPTTATGLVLHFNCDLFSGGSADVALS